MSARRGCVVTGTITNLTAQIGSGLYLLPAQSCRLNQTLFGCKEDLGIGNFLVTQMLLHGSMEIIHQVKMKALSDEKYVSPGLDINA